MTKQFKNYTNILFAIYLFLGSSYIVFLTLFSIKVIPGFIMQTLFLIDEINHGSETINNLLSNATFLQSMFFGLIAICLAIISLQGVIKSVKQYYQSKKYLNSLKILSVADGVVTFKNDSCSVFTAGFINTRIFVSNKLKANLSEDQLNAILYHEDSHRKDKDPLRSFIVQLINNLLPNFPFKKSFFNVFKTSVELKSDENSENIIGKKRPIVEALYSVLKHNQFSQPNFSYFSNMPERIPILVGARKFNYRFSTALASVILFVAVALPVVAYTYEFYKCEHITECIEIFVNSMNSTSTESLSSMHPMSSSEGFTKN